MDKDFDIIGAAVQLERLALDRYNSQHSGLQLSRVASLSARYEAVAVGTAWKLAHKGAEEEVVASFQGVIYKEDLPPFVEKISKHSAHVKHLRQSVTIVGLGSATFDKVVNVVADIHALLSRAVGINKVEGCGMVANYGGTQSIEVSNRYFTQKSGSASIEDEVAISADLDPHGYLAQAASSRGVYHSTENRVDYFQREGDDDSYKYRPARPAIFSIGDIVEVQCSFVVFPLRGGKFKTAAVLRSITLIDGTFTQARLRNLVKAEPTVISKSTLKRRSAYQEEELSVTNAKMVRMEIDERTVREQRDVE